MLFYPTPNLLDFALFAYEYIEFMYPVDNCILSIQDKELWLLSFEFLSGQKVSENYGACNGKHGMQENIQS